MSFAEPGVVFLNAGREEAEAYLSNAVPGSYVVRPSSRPGNLSLTYRTREAANRLGHLLLVREAAGWTTEGVPYHFPTVRELLLRLPYGLRLQDEQMYAAPANQRPASAAAPGYAAVPTAAQMMNASPAASGGYGRLPLKDDAAAAASPVNALNENNGYGRAPTIPNTPATSGDYGRVPPNRANATGTSEDYGRVPQANGGGGGAAAATASPYARLQPTSTLTRGVSGGNVLVGIPGGIAGGGGGGGGGVQPTRFSNQLQHACYRRVFCCCCRVVSCRVVRARTRTQVINGTKFLTDGDSKQYDSLTLLVKARASILVKVRAAFEAVVVVACPFSHVVRVVVQPCYDPNKPAP